MSSTALPGGWELQIRAKSTMDLDGSAIRIVPEVRAYLADEEAESFIAQMANGEVYELGPAGGVPSFKDGIMGSLSKRGIAVPDNLDPLIREAARASMKMSAVLMAEVHLEYLREEDFAEAWRAAHVLNVMDT